MENDNLFSNFHQLCRLCLSNTNSKIHVFEIEGFRRNLNQKILNCLSLAVAERDNLPKFVCHCCVSQLETFQEFRETCHKSSKLLITYLAKHDYAIPESLSDHRDPLYMPSSLTPRISSSYALSDPVTEVTSSEIEIKVEDDYEEANVGQEADNLINFSYEQIGIESDDNSSSADIKPRPLSIPSLNSNLNSGEEVISLSDQDQNVGESEVFVEDPVGSPGSSTRQISEPEDDIGPSLTSEWNYEEDGSCVVLCGEENGAQSCEFPDSNITSIYDPLQSTSGRLSPPQFSHRDADRGPNRFYLKHPTASSNYLMVKKKLGGSRVRKVQNIVPPSRVRTKNSLLHKVKRPALASAKGQIGSVKHSLEINRGKSVLNAKKTFKRSFKRTGGTSALKIRQRSGGFGKSNVPEPEDENSSYSGRTGSNQISLNDEENNVIAPSAIGRYVQKKGKNFICRLCGQTYVKYYSVIIHVKGHIRDRIHVCALCRKAYTTAANLKRHLISHAKKSYVCKICGVNLKEKQLYLEHMQQHSIEDVPDEKQLPFSCNECGEKFSEEEELKSHLEIHDEKKCICNVCGKKFEQEKLLNVHLQTHNNQNQCDVCSKIFSTRSNMLEHKKIHMNIRRFLCRNCGKRFRRRDHLRSHLTMHLKMKPFMCDKCNKCFSSKELLDEHLARHAQKKAYPCPQCKDVAFERKDYFVRHMKNHSEGRDHFCKLCKRMFAKIEEFTAHMQKHNGKLDSMQKCKLSDVKKICKKCGVPVPKEQFRDHMKVQHNIEESFTCKQCKDVFTSRSDLIKHLRTHTKVKPMQQSAKEDSTQWPCTECGKIFSSNVNLKRHMFYHTGISERSVKEAERKGKLNPVLKIKDSSNPVKKLNFTKVPTVTSGPVSNKKFKCKTCPKAFYHRIRLVQHLLQHIQDQKNAADVPQADVEVLDMVQSDASTVHKCGLCDRTFGSEELLNSHVDSETSESACAQLRVIEGNLQTSDAPIDDLDGLFPCKKCGRKFTTKSKLNGHMHVHAANYKKRSKWTFGVKSRKHICLVCGEKFQNAAQLWLHRRSHKQNETTYGENITDDSSVHPETESVEQLDTREEKYPLEVKSVDGVVPLEDSEKNATMPTQGNVNYPATGTLKKCQVYIPGSQKFGCNVCGKVFDQYLQLRGHSRIHSPNYKRIPKCSICDEIFPNCVKLRQHMRTHSLKYKFKETDCKVCGKVFDTYQKLNGHMHIHGPSYKKTGLGIVNENGIDSVSVDDELASSTKDSEMLEGVEPLPRDDDNVSNLGSEDAKSENDHEAGKRVKRRCVSDSSCSKYVEDSSDVDGSVKEFPSRRRAMKKKQHYKVVKESENCYPCEICGKIFYKVRQLTGHLRIHGSFYTHLKYAVGNSKYKCEKCEKIFDSASVFRDHLQEHGEVVDGKLKSSLEDNSIKDDESDFVDVDTVEDIPGKDYSEDVINFPDPKVKMVSNECATVNNEKKLVKSELDSAAEKTVKKPKRPKENKLATKSKVKGVLPEVTEDPEKKKTVVRSPTKIKIFSCKICGEKFMNVDKFKQHKKLHNPSRARCVCKECGKTYANSSCLYRHMVIHTGFKKHVCQFCNKSYFRQDQLKAHVEMHMKTLLG